MEERIIVVGELVVTVKVRTVKLCVTKRYGGSLSDSFEADFVARELMNYFRSVDIVNNVL